jgi:Rod binding domain-containing protein
MNIAGIANGSAAAQPGPAENMKLRRAAQDFEAILIGTWLKEVQESFASSGESAGAESYRSLGVEAVAGALARSGALGIARMLLHQLAGAAAAAPAKDVP